MRVRSGADIFNWNWTGEVQDIILERRWDDLVGKTVNGYEIVTCRRAGGDIRNIICQAYCPLCKRNIVSRYLREFRYQSGCKSCAARRMASTRHQIAQGEETDEMRASWIAHLQRCRAYGCKPGSRDEYMNELKCHPELVHPQPSIVYSDVAFGSASPLTWAQGYGTEEKGE